MGIRLVKYNIHLKYILILFLEQFQPRKIESGAFKHNFFGDSQECRGLSKNVICKGFFVSAVLPNIFTTEEMLFQLHLSKVIVVANDLFS